MLAKAIDLPRQHHARSHQSGMKEVKEKRITMHLLNLADVAVPVSEGYRNNRANIPCEDQIGILDPVNDRALPGTSAERSAGRHMHSGRCRFRPTTIQAREPRTPSLRAGASRSQAGRSG